MPVCVGPCGLDKPQSEYQNHQTRCKSCRAAGDRLRRYNITYEEFELRLRSQNEMCALCRGHMDETDRVVDHDHFCCPGERSCGKCVRGIIHHHCNRLLGTANDDPDMLYMAIRYLTRENNGHQE